MEIKEIREDAIVFDTCFEEDVAYVPDSMVKTAEEIVLKTNRGIAWIDCDFKETTFFVDSPYTPKERERLMAPLLKKGCRS